MRLQVRRYDCCAEAGVARQNSSRLRRSSTEAKLTKLMTGEVDEVDGAAAFPMFTIFAVVHTREVAVWQSRTSDDER